MSNRAILVEGLSKQYRIGFKPVRYFTLRESLSRLAQRSILSRARRAKADDATFWALKDVSFDVRQGEVLGIIGRNGAGKSTLLKILAAITDPTRGRAEIRGRVASLLEVGTGFHPELTGRENIYLSGAILGMRRAEIARKFDEIVAFAGVDRFIDSPVKHFSSGMHVRLGFAVAAHLEPEILLVDEVLAVGDAHFQEKCLGRISQIVGSGRTVLFVSHNLSAMRTLCTRAVLLDGGMSQLQGTPEEVIAHYLSTLGSADGRPETLEAGRDRSGSGAARVTSLRARAAGSASNPPRTGGDAEVVIEYVARDGRTIPRLMAAVSVGDVDGSIVFGVATDTMRHERALSDLPPAGQIVCVLKNLPLIPGKYWLTVVLKDASGVMDRIDRAVSFTVIDDGTSGVVAFPSRRWAGNIVFPHEWNVRPLVDTVSVAQR